MTFPYLTLLSNLKDLKIQLLIDNYNLLKFIFDLSMSKIIIFFLLLVPFSFVKDLNRQQPNSWIAKQFLCKAL